MVGKEEVRPAQVITAEYIRKLGDRLARAENERSNVMAEIAAALSEADNVGIPREYFLELLGVRSNAKARKTSLAILRRKQLPAQ